VALAFGNQVSLLGPAGGEIARLSQKAHPGWSRVCARVIAEGLVRMGDTVELA